MKKNWKVEKKCSSCKKIKLLVHFYPDKIKKDNCSSRCRSCALEYSKTPEAKKYKKGYWKRQEILKKKREYNRTPEAKKKRREYLQKPEIKERISTYSKHPKHIKKSKEYRLMTMYCLTIAEHKKMILEQDNKCAICGTTMKRPCVDHCHKTSRVRGILCSNCNQGLGYFKDKIINLNNAVKYLKKYGK